MEQIRHEASNPRVLRFPMTTIVHLRLIILNEYLVLDSNRIFCPAVRKLVMHSYIIARVGVYVGVCVCIRTNTHKHCTDGVFGCEPRNRNETLGGPEESRWTKSRHIYIHKCVQSTHVYVYARRRDEILDFLLFSLASFFLSKKNKSKRCERKPPIISKVKYMI